MARRYSKRKGKSSSKKPSKKVVPSWVRYEKREVEAIIAKLAKEGLTASQIGMRLRDTYGVPDVKVITGKSITHVMKEKNVLPKLPEDLKALLVRYNKLVKHLENNSHDKTAKRGMMLTESKILRLVKYYQRKKALPEGWKYDPKKISLLVQQ